MGDDSRRRRRGPDGRVTATEAAKNFGHLVDRVREERASYIVERGGTPVARITPIERASFTMADFVALVSRHSRVDEDYLTAVERGLATRNRRRRRRNPWGR